MLSSPSYLYLHKREYNQFTQLVNYVLNYLLNYPVFTNLGILWNFGFASFFFLAIQLLTGFLLSMHYVANADSAFLSVEQIMRDVNSGWLLRYLHANGASFFFLCVYVHVIRSLYYSSYVSSRKDTWVIGVVILVLLIATAFTGYVLPWGQMSFWAATVITNLFSAIPFYGTEVVNWLWGGFSVNSFTLTRFFSLHFILPFVILACVVLHIIFLHVHGGNNKFNIFMLQDKIRFFPYYLFKDFFYTNLIFLFYFYFVGFSPNFLLHVDNYVPADPLVTPAHIVPEWYFLLFYAILRSIPSKAGGIVILMISILILFSLPYLKYFYTYTQEIHFSWTTRKYLFNKNLAVEAKKFLNLDLNSLNFWFLVITSLLLGYIGSQPIESPYLTCGRILTIFYFLYFILVFFLNKNLKNIE